MLPALGDEPFAVLKLGFRVTFFVDNEAVCVWINGKCRVDDALHASAVASLQDRFVEVQRLGRASSWTLYSPFVKAIARTGNAEADRLANLALDFGKGGLTDRLQHLRRPCLVHHRAHLFLHSPHPVSTAFEEARRSSLCVMDAGPS